MFPEQIAYLSDLGEIDYETVYIDGTKIESNANRYRFVWRKSVEKHVAKLREKAADLYGDDVTIKQLEAQVQQLRSDMVRQDIAMVSGTGRRKPELQRKLEELEKLVAKWREYEMHLAIMGPDRNSYAKTDKDATFMRMKDDHMRNGQLKPAYNVQLAVNSEYIVGYGIFSNRTDSATLKTMLQTMEQQHGRKYESVTADAGYESLENYTYLDECEQLSFIKPASYEQSKKKSNWVGHMRNMSYDPASDSFTCQNGKCLTLTYRGKQKSSTGFESEYSMYQCTECSGCPLRQRCSKAEHKHTKQMRVCWEFVHKRQASLENITSEKGTLFRVNRSIQNEGAFGVLKQDWGFRRFLTRGNENILAQVGLLAFAFNVKKLHAKRRCKRMGTQYFELNMA